ncbi:uncharacterized protein LOC9323904 [Arabidopsis lyrata subsp. lyrata]|nr:uncharacterized protein LOC9323904 [Arabidopsis lyrata subsp. lyrata]|eukprot:XP_002889304.2 uncharacterized protein LOC9323904 [Arabidopsis lyrata subsp. lyrata]
MLYLVKFQIILAGKMCKERRIMCESSNKIRVSPYPLRSTRTNKLKAIESPIETEWEDVRCVICMEPPHDAVLLTCSSSLNGCRPYMCGTSVRHSNCFKQFSRNNRKKHSNTKTLHCPLCRGEVFETKKAAKTTRRFMNAKPRSCPVDDCEFSATYSHLNKHLKTEHRGIVPTKVDPQRQCRWEMMERHAEYVNLMTAAGIPHMSEVVHHQLPNNHHLPMFHVNFNGTLQNLIGPSNVSNGFSLVNHASLFIPTLQFRPMDMYRGRNP